jgi:ABC-type sugar transport system permease subunit
MARRKEFKRDNLSGYLLIGPWIIGLICFQLWPIIHSLLLSFTKYSILSEPVFIGIENYINMSKDKLFFKATTVTLKYVFIAVPAKLVFAFIIAMIMNIKLKGIGLFRTIYYIPSIFGSSIAVAILWKSLFVKDGIINQMLARLGTTGPAWLGNPKYVLFTLSLLTVWQFGSSMVTFLAGLKQISGSLYEAAAIDGANKLQSFVHVTIPGIMPMIWFNMLMQTIFAFQTFAAPYTIFGGTGGPMNSGLLYIVYLYRQAFKQFNMGYASALSWTLLIIISLTAGFLYFIQKKLFNYDTESPAVRCQ